MNRLCVCSLFMVASALTVNPVFSQDAAKPKPKPLRALLINWRMLP